MKILIGGGNGLIGRSLAVELAGWGHEIVILSRSPENVADKPAGIQIEKWDARTTEGWYKLASGADAIVNLAGANIGSERWTRKRKRELVKSRLNAGHAIAQAVEKVSHKPRVVIQASAVGYYGDGGDGRITEESPKGVGFLADLASEWEASTQTVERLGIRRVIIRTGVVLSEKGGALPKMSVPFRLFSGGKLGAGRQWIPWIHIKDEVRAIKFLIENDNARGPFNLTSPNSVSNAEFTRILGRQLRRPARLTVPAFILRAALGEMATVVLDGQKAIPERLLRLGFVFCFPDAGRALQNLLS